MARLPPAEISRSTLSECRKDSRRSSMTLPGGFTKRDVLMKIGILLNRIVAAILAVPIVRYLLSHVASGRKGGYESWVPLGNIEQFPSGQTRLATYRNPVA